MSAEDSDAIQHLRARLWRRLQSRARARGSEAEELDVEIAELEATIDEMVLARKAGLPPREE